MKKTVWFFLAGLFFILSCTDIKPVPVSITGTGQPIDFEKYEKYGAVLEYDDYRIKAEFSPYNGCETFYYINRKIHILNQRGVEYGTIDLRNQDGELLALDIEVISKTGIKESIDLESIKEKYEESSQIIIPKVEPGCQILLKLTFIESDPLYNEEYYFERNIPVIKGRFSLFYRNNFKYDYKTYGALASQDFKDSSLNGFVVDCDNIFPQKGFSIPEANIHFRAWRHPKSPKVFLRLKKLTYGRHDYFRASGWETISRKYNELLLSPSLFSSKERIDRLTREIIKPAASDFEKADKLLEYIQDNFTIDGVTDISSYSIDTDSVLSQKRGNSLEIAAIFREMLTAAGFSPRVYASRPSHEGGFDPDFPSWWQVWYQFFVIPVDGKDYLAYPYIPKLRLGEYPFFMADEKALNLETGKIESPPASADRNATYASEAKLSLSYIGQAHNWTFQYGNQLAILLRRDISEHSRLGIKERFKKILEAYDEHHELNMAILKNIERGKEIEVLVGYQTNGLKTEYNGKAHITLKPFFKKYFTDYEKYNETNYSNPLEFVINESVLIQKNEYRNVQVIFDMEKIENSLFSVEYAKDIDEKQIRVSRKLTLKEITLTPQELRFFNSDIQKLNRISESHLIAE